MILLLLILTACGGILWLRTVEEIVETVIDIEEEYKMIPLDSR